jgi:hypothetical protein
VYRILTYIQSTHSPLGRAYKVTDELFDLSTMAMEYFKVSYIVGFSLSFLLFSRYKQLHYGTWLVASGLSG